jgi:hypothetical protein
MQQPFFRGFLFCLAALSSQSVFSQNTFGVFAGPQITTAKYKIQDEKQPVQFQAGLQLGATIKVPFENNLYFAPALYYSKKGYKVRFNKPAFPPDSLALNNETVLHTMEIAPMLHYDFGKKPGHFFLKLGPAIDIAFSGKEKFKTTEGKLIDRSMKFSFGDYGRFTAQAILHFGYETPKGLIVFAHYGEGLGSLNNADGGPRIKHRIAGLSLGWYFSKNPNVIDTRVKE